MASAVDRLSTQRQAQSWLSCPGESGERQLPTDSKHHYVGAGQHSHARNMTGQLPRTSMRPAGHRSADITGIGDHTPPPPACICQPQSHQPCTASAAPCRGLLLQHLFKYFSYRLRRLSTTKVHPAHGTACRSDDHQNASQLVGRTS